MTNHNDTQAWVDAKMASLHPFEPALGTALNRLRQKQDRQQTVRRNSALGIASLVLIALVAASIPSAKAFASRCVEACVAAISGTPPLRSSDSKALDSYRGKVLLVNYWATWCPPCREELPALETLRRRYEPAGLAIVGVSADEGSWDHVIAFVAAQKLGFKLEDLNSDLSRHFGPVESLPVTILVDRGGNEISRKLGKIDSAALERQIVAALNASTPRSTSR